MDGRPNNNFVNFITSWRAIICSICISCTSIFIFNIFYNFRSSKCKSNSRLDGKTVVITGGSSGIGKSAAFNLSSRGARVVLACRNEAKTLQIAKAIIKSTGNKQVIYYHLNTSDLKSVRNCAQKILENEERIDVLINNAGTAEPCKRKLTSDGLEYIMATNHYGHFLFTNILLGRIKECSPSRIINVSSSIHQMCAKLDPEDLNFEKCKFSNIKAYSQSKLCNILFTLELVRKLKGTGVTANSLHPGFVNTEIFGKSNGFVLQIVNWIVAPLFAKTSEMGAQTIIHLAVSEEVAGVTGKYFVDCQAVEPRRLGTHLGLAKKLWLASELDVQLDDSEIHYVTQ